MYENAEDSLDLNYLNQTHLSFMKYNFSVDDLNYLETVKERFLHDSSLENMLKVFSDITTDNQAYLVQAMATIYERASRINSKNLS